MELLQTASYVPQHIDAGSPEPPSIRTFDQIKDRTYDGMIITGAPVENLDFCRRGLLGRAVPDHGVDQGPTSTATLHICWGAQAGLYYHYGIPKYTLPQKLFGVFPHKVVQFPVSPCSGALTMCFTSPTPVTLR